ncbi:hypothetical protein ILYODFUR_022518 [Ilyodon furcidens]|uniref:Uncharacterized protein n=1 Tax=Ilyodon furcidens TaxID=33524 RepID=A0ABV0UI78_9TELE
MEAFVPRLYLAPVKDEEAESQRKAKSRHARQTRRSTQGVTLTDLKEAQMSYSLSHQDREKEEESTLSHRPAPCLRRGFADETGDQSGLTESKETSEFTLNWSQMDKEGNIENQLETVVESPDLSNLSIYGYCGFPQSNSFFRVGERRRRDENQNPVEDAAHLTFSTTLQQRYLCCDAQGTEVCGNPSLVQCYTNLQPEER